MRSIRTLSRCGVAALSAGALLVAVPAEAAPVAPAASLGAAVAPSAVVASAQPVAAVPSAQPVAAVQAAARRPVLRQGARGAAVRRLQSRLQALNYDVGAVDGVFGGDTLHAVYAFQKVQGLTVDGVVGRRVWTALADPRVPVARYDRRRAAVEVDLSLRVLYLTKGGRVTRIVDASPGKPATRTPTGRYSVTRRIDGWRRSRLGLLWRPNYFVGGYAVHGSKSVPTYSASHGCVRVTIAAMDRLWPELHRGQRVFVYR